MNTAGKMTADSRPRNTTTMKNSQEIEDFLRGLGPAAKVLGIKIPPEFAEPKPIAASPKPAPCSRNTAETAKPPSRAGSKKPGGGNKYGAVRTPAEPDSSFPHEVYDSKAEAARARVLDKLLRAGLIRYWKPKPGAIRLGCAENVYRPDFFVVGINHEWYEDVKGKETAKFKKDRKLWAIYGNRPLHLLTSGEMEIVRPKGMTR